MPSDKLNTRQMGIEGEPSLPTVYNIASDTANLLKNDLIIIPDMVERMLVLADQNVAAGRFPYVGLLEYNGKVIAEAVNTIYLPTSKADLPIFEPPEAHPELKLASEAVRIARETFPDDHTAQLDFLQRITVYANCEPCTMCGHAMAGALVNKLVYSISHNAAIAASGIDVPPLATTDQIYKTFGLSVEIVGSVEAERALITFQRAWDQVNRIVNG